jgi:hypothetical protein
MSEVLHCGHREMAGVWVNINGSGVLHARPRVLYGIGFDLVGAFQAVDFPKPADLAADSAGFSHHLRTIWHASCLNHV